MNPCEENLQAQLEERVRFESLLADLSAKFVGLPPEALDQEIEEAQRRICETLGLDRSVLGQPSNSGEQFTHSWAIPGCSSTPAGRISHLLPWCTRQINSGRMIRFASVDELPPEADFDKCFIRRAGTKSNVSFPLVVGGKVMGVLWFSTLKTERQWPEDLVSRLRLVAESLPVRWLVALRKRHCATRLRRWRR